MASLRDQYSRGLFKLAAGAQPGKTPQQQQGGDPGRQEQDRPRGAGKDLLESQDQDETGAEQQRDLPLDADTRSLAPRAEQDVLDHVQAGVGPQQQAEEQDPNADPGRLPAPVGLPPMLKDVPAPFGAAQALLDTIPGARGVYQQYASAGTEPAQAMIETLDELHGSGALDELGPAHQMLAKMVGDHLGWQPQLPSPAEQAQEQSQDGSGEAVEGQPGQGGATGAPGAAGVPQGPQPAKPPVEKIVKEKTVTSRPIPPKQEGQKKAASDLDSLLKLAHDRTEELDRIHLEGMLTTEPWIGPRQGVAYGRSLRAGAEKLARETESRLRQTGRAVVQALPAVAATSLAEWPKGKIEDAAAGFMGRKLKVSFPPSDRPLGKMVGRAGVSVATMPLFLSGLRDLKSQDKKDRKKGLLKIVGATSVYGGGKGAAGVYGALHKGEGGKKALVAAMRNVGGLQAGLGVGKGLLVAKAITSGQRKGKDSPLRAAGIGAGLGAASGLVEAPLESGGYKTLGKATRGPALRRMASRSVARGASGAIGGLVIDQIAKRMLGKKP